MVCFGFEFVRYDDFVCFMVGFLVLVAGFTILVFSLG